MENRKKYRYGAILILVGVIIGFLITANFGLTGKTQALSTANNSESTVLPEDEGGQAGRQALQALSNAFASVAVNVNPSVVTIFTETIIKQRRTPFFQFPFEDFFGEDFGKYFQNPETPQREQRQQGLGSGVIVADNGFIITNNHVVQGADDIKIRLMDNREYEAEIKGTDPRTDLAIIKIKADNLQAIKFGNSDVARVGEWVLAIGSPLSPNLAHTVTSGIISAKGRSGLFDPRQFEDFIQTDAAINPGNSGGALVNLKGELIGINTAIASRTGGFLGIGFAIPSNLANKVMTDILEKGRVVRGWLGVYIQDVTEDLAKALKLENPSGVLISSVQDDSPAKKAGLKSEDVILQFDDKEVKNSTELRNLVASNSPNTTVTLKILRDGKKMDVRVKLGEFPEEKSGQPTAVASKAKEKIGIEVANLSSSLVERYELKIKKGGVVITNVGSGSVAAQSGLRPGDVILKVNRKPVENLAKYNELMEDVNSGDSLLFYIQRGEGKVFIAFSVPEK
jgi:serine protease Do